MLTDKEREELERLNEVVAQAEANGSNKDCFASNMGHLSYLFYCRNADRRDELIRKRAKG